MRLNIKVGTLAFQLEVINKQIATCVKLTKHLNLTKRRGLWSWIEGMERWRRRASVPLDYILVNLGLDILRDHQDRFQAG